MRVVDLKIEDIAFGGKGVAREKGKAVFVPYTIEDELVSAEIVREKKQFAEAELVEVKESSPNRVAPQCPYFGRCGGCAYQHIDYQHQLAIKWRQVRDALQRIGKLKDVPMRPIIPSPRHYTYRNRIRERQRERDVYRRRCGKRTAKDRGSSPETLGARGRYVGRTIGVARRHNNHHRSTRDRVERSRSCGHYGSCATNTHLRFM